MVIRRRPRTAFCCLAFRLAAAAVASVAAVGAFVRLAPAAQAKQTSYPQALDLAVAAMEEGKQIQALGPMRTALSIDRAEPYGVIALGTLYLQSGNYRQARVEFARAHDMLPSEPLASWGIALADLASGKRDPAAFDAIPASAIPAAPTVAAYVRLLDGDTLGVAENTKSVGPTETDALRLEMAAFTAFKAGDSARGTALLEAFVARPDMKELSEDRTLLLLFDPNRPAEGGAPPLGTSLGFPEPASGFPLNGQATLTPPFGMPADAAMVTYSTEGGGGWSTTTNNPPFTAQWNTARYPNGPYDIHTVAYDADHHVVLDSHRTYILQNAGAPTSLTLSDRDRQEMRQRLLVLLTPRASRKAAYWALAEQARLRSDEPDALANLEAVVAVDPRFNNAYEILHGYRPGDPSAAPISWWRGNTNEKLVALTFDDGPNPLPARTPALLDTLKSCDAHATFFVIGARAEQCTDLLKRMDAQGDEIADHSFSHANLTFLDPAAIERELGRTSVIIREATGKRPHFYRPPGGNFNRNVTAAADALGMQGAFWTLDGLKWEGPPFTPENLTQYVLKNVKPGSIVLLHNAPENTIRAVPQIVAGLRAKGYELVTMSELARRCRPIPIPAATAAAYGYH